jgi:hypothetical protein
MMVFVMELKIVCLNIIVVKIKKKWNDILGTLERFCQSNGSWAMTVSPDTQCKSCVGDIRPVKVD